MSNHEKRRLPVSPRTFQDIFTDSAEGGFCISVRNTDAGVAIHIECSDDDGCVHVDEADGEATHCASWSLGPQQVQELVASLSEWLAACTRTYMRQKGDV